MRNLLSRVLRSFGFYVAILLGFIGMVSDSAYAFFHSDYMAQHDFLYWTASAFTYGITKLFLPIIAALPITCFCIADRKSGYRGYVMHRCGTVRYIAQRIGAACLSGVIAALSGLCLYFLYIAIRCPLFTNLEQSIRTTAGPIFRSWVLLPCGWPYLIIEMICLCTTACTWSLLSLCFSSFLHRSGQLIGLTFFVHYSLSWSLSGTEWSGWSPMRLQSPSVWCTEPLSNIAIRLTVYLVLSVFAAWIGECRSLRLMQRKGAK